MTTVKITTIKKTHVKWIAIAGGIAVAIGIVLVIRALKSSSGLKDDHSKPPPGKQPPAPAKASSPSVFPIKNGSPYSDLVKQLQGYLGVPADGFDGPKTTAALLAKTGKTSITSQADFDAVIAKLQATAQTSANVSRADQLVLNWTNNAAMRLIATANVLAYGVIEDAYGALTLNGKNIGLAPGFFYNRNDYMLLSSTNNGYLKFRVTSGDRMGLYKVDASKVSLG